MRKSNSKIKAVTLDLWQTLLLDRDGASERRNLIRCQNLSKALGQIGIEASVMKLSSVLNETSSWLATVWASDREVTHYDQIRFVLEKASGVAVEMSDERLKLLSSAYVSPILEHPPYLDPAANRLLQWLRGGGKGVGLISNVGMTPGFVLRRVLQMQGIAHYFDALIFSDEVGIRKPDRSIFHLTAEKLDARPSEIVHIGDDLRSDALGAKNAGFRTILLSTDVGRDMIAERDPTSLVSITREFGSGLRIDEVAPDRTITSLDMAIEAIKQLDY